MAAVVSGNSDVSINHLVSSSKQIKCEKQVVISLFTRSPSADMWYGTCWNSAFECVKRGWEFVYGVCVCVLEWAACMIPQKLTPSVTYRLSLIPLPFAKQRMRLLPTVPSSFKTIQTNEISFFLSFFMPWLTHNPSIYSLIWGTLVNYCSWVVMTNSAFA